MHRARPSLDYVSSAMHWYYESWCVLSKFVLILRARQREQLLICTRATFIRVSEIDCVSAQMQSEWCPFTRHVDAVLLSAEYRALDGDRVVPGPRQPDEVRLHRARHHGLRTGDVTPLTTEHIEACFDTFFVINFILTPSCGKI